MTVTEILINRKGSWAPSVVNGQSSWTAWVHGKGGAWFDLGNVLSLPEAVKLADEAYLAGNCGYAKRWRFADSFVALPIDGPQRFADAPTEDNADGND